MGSRDGTKRSSSTRDYTLRLRHISCNPEMLAKCLFCLVISLMIYFTYLLQSMSGDRLVRAADNSQIHEKLESLESLLATGGANTDKGYSTLRNVKTPPTRRNNHKKTVEDDGEDTDEDDDRSVGSGPELMLINDYSNENNGAEAAKDRKYYSLIGASSVLPSNGGGGSRRGMKLARNQRTRAKAGKKQRTGGKKKNSLLEESGNKTRHYSANTERKTGADAEDEIKMGKTRVEQEQPTKQDAITSSSAATTDNQYNSSDIRSMFRYSKLLLEDHPKLKVDEGSKRRPLFVYLTPSEDQPSYNSTRKKEMITFRRKGKKVKERTESVWDVDRLQSDSRGTCISGQGIINMPPICGYDKCLQDIKITENSPPRLKINLTEADLSFIDAIPGWMYMEHAQIVNMLTDIQWSLGVYGTVGEIGVYKGRFASVLALHTDTARGERLFACDTFDRSGQSKPHMFNHAQDDFLKNMAQFDFYLNHPQAANRLYHWYGSSAYFTKYAFAQMEIPSVRMFSIDGFHYDTMVFHELVQSLCILHPGGIIAIDDLYRDTVQQAIIDFMELVSRDVLRPLIAKPGKLYLATSDWYDVYMEEIDKRKGDMLKFNLTRSYKIAGHDCFWDPR